MNVLTIEEIKAQYPNQWVLVGLILENQMYLDLSPVNF